TAHFGSSSSSPVEVLVRGDGPQYADFVSRISALPQVAAATSTPLASGGTLVELAPSGGDASASGLALVREIRADRGDLNVQVAGTPAQVVDFEGMLRAGAPWAIGFVCLTILTLLF